MDLSCLFGRSGPVHIEVGSGKGTFVLNQAKLHPEINFLGIEWANQFYRYCVDRICRWEMENVRILRTDARDFIGRYVKDETVAALHIYFPDPWPKKRHHKRRFFATENILQVARILVKGGELRAATDHADYFEIISDVLLRQPKTADLFEEIEFYPAASANPGEWVGSNFERKYIKEGRKFYTIAVRKR
jgi:tRNA (guanine-N7-)-methyltransferase